MWRAGWVGVRSIFVFENGESAASTEDRASPHFAADRLLLPVFEK